MKIGLVYAMADEISSILAIYDMPEPIYHCGIPFYEISENIVAVAGGMGKVNIAAATGLLCELYPDIELVLNSGLAGGFVDMPIGTLVLIDHCVQHDVDTSVIGDPIGLVSTVNKIDFPSSMLPEISRILREENIDFRIGSAATGDWFATAGERTERIVQLFSPTVADMEAGAIAQICYRAGVDFVSLKAVSDILSSGMQHAQFYKSLDDITKEMNHSVRILVDRLVKLDKQEVHSI